MKKKLFWVVVALLVLTVIVLVVVRSLPITYKGLALPTPAQVGPDTVLPPAAWLIVGDTAVLASYGSSCYRAGLVFGPTGCGDMPAPWDRPDLAAATLPAETPAVVVIASTAIEEFHATVRPWTEEPVAVPVTALKAESKREVSVTAFTLEPLGEAGDQLLEVSVTYNQGGASYFWRLNPAPAATATASAIATTLPSVEIPASCAAQSEDRTPYFNLADGYCLLYPAYFRVADVRPGLAGFYGPPLDQTSEPVFGALLDEWRSVPGTGTGMPAHDRPPGGSGEGTPSDVGTTSVVAADEEGLVVSMTPSGAWNPAVVAGRTGIGLSQRMQAFVLDASDNPYNVVAPGKQPRVTLTPALSLKDGLPHLAFAVQGGDTQDQSLLQSLLAPVEDRRPCKRFDGTIELVPDLARHRRSSNGVRRLGGQAGRGQLRLQRGIDADRIDLSVDFLQELPQHFGIAQRPVARAALQAVALDQTVQVVAAVFGKELARELGRAQHARAVGHAQARKFALEKTVVEARVMRDEQLALEALEQSRRELLEPGRMLHHLVADAGERLDERWNALFRIYQLAPAVHAFAVGHLDQADLGDALMCRNHAGGLEVEEDQRLGEHGHGASGHGCHVTEKFN